jgi:hypothetical protein
VNRVNAPEILIVEIARNVVIVTVIVIVIDVVAISEMIIEVNSVATIARIVDAA